MKQKNKREYIDKLNDEFIKLSIKNGTNEYNVFYDKILNNVMKFYENNKKITLSDIKKIVDKVQFNNENLKYEVVNAIILSGITNVIENQRLDKQDKSMLLPVILLVSAYGINKPKLLASKTNKLTRAVLSSDYKDLSAKDKKLAKSLRVYIKSNDKIVNDIIKTRSKQDIKRIKYIKKSVSKGLNKSIKKEIKFEKKEVIKRVTKKFKNQQEWRVRNAIDTETHTLIEDTKINQHISLGYTTKTWVTQQDRKVRDSHNRLQGKKIDINKKFRVGGHWALYPSEASLPPKERINCRCFLVFTK